MTDISWFKECTIQSHIKSEIISKYFWVWAKIIIPRSRSKKIAYIDLFAGPGRYEDGTKSTPLRILEKAISEPAISNSLVAIFNDLDKNNTQSLQKAIAELPGIEKLKYRPTIFNHEIGTDIVQDFEKMRFIPTFFFVDPWGYKGLTVRLINSVLKNWGCDCIFFFNYNRINMGLGNNMVKEHMNALFGEERAEKLREKLENLKACEREFAIVEEIVMALKEMDGRYVLPFCFRNNQGTRTSHYLIFVSKNPLGYGIMKQIMADYSSIKDQGVPSFTYCPADEKYPLLFELTRPLDDLYDRLPKQFKGKTLTCKDIYDIDNINKPYIFKNYQEVLKRLEADEIIIAEPPVNKRRKNKGEPTFSGTVKVTFPNFSQMRMF